MSWIEVTISGRIAYLRTVCIAGVLPDVKKSGSVIYMDGPIEALSVDESAEDVYAMLYEEEEEEEDEEDDITDEQYSDIIKYYSDNHMT